MLESRAAQSMKGAHLAALLVLGGCSASHVNDDPEIVPGVHGSRTLYSLTDEEIAAVCGYFADYGGFSDETPELECPSEERPMMFVADHCIVPEYNDPRCPTVGLLTECITRRIDECRAGLAEHTQEWIELCALLRRDRCTRELE
jgi:hypothetical protein